MRIVSLRQRLLALAAVAILPLALMSGVALRALLEQQRLQIEQSGLDLTRALVTAVDTELRLTISTLQTLAATEPLVGGADPALDDFHRLSRRVMASRPEWLGLMLADASGHVLFSTDRAPGLAPEPITDNPSFDQAVRSAAPVIGSLARDAHGRASVPVRVPIVRDGRPLYVLTAFLKPDAVLGVVERQRVPADWIVSVFDAESHRVARSRDHLKYLGTAAGPSLLALVKPDTDEVVGTTTTLEGDTVLTAFTRSKATGWAVAMGVPTAVTTAALRDSAVAYGGGILLSMALGSLAAFLVARGIAEPIAQLRKAALALGGGEPLQLSEPGFVEIEAVSEALTESAWLRERSEAERERLLVAERRAREEAELAQRRLELLAGTGSLLSRSLEEETTLQAIASVIVPDLADICRIDLLDKDGKLQRKLTHHRDPARAEAIAGFVGKGQVSADTPGSFPYAIATGETFLQNFGSPEGFDTADPTFRGFAHTTGMRAVCVIPLVARGRTIGAMGALQAESGRNFSAEDGVLLAELAQRAALALDNVRLFGESRAALAEAEVANRAKDDFLAMLGHELRNPLAPIVTSLELMARRDRDANAPERRIIERQVAHLARLVDDLLDVSRIASGKVKLNLERLDLRDVLAQALELAQPALQGRQRTPDIVVPGQPVWVMGDASRLAQVVANLLSNAAKFSSNADAIGIELAARGDEAQLCITDTGMGIQAELLPHVFERFVQAAQALHRGAGGLGLGLAIARSLVELHGGSVRAESDGPGRGSRFTIVLPLAAEEPAPLLLSAPAAPEAAGSARILVVDDNADAVDALSELLRLEGHEVRAAGSAEDAIALLDEFQPQIALLDIGLPRMDGYELARVLRADPRVRSARLIALTGYGREPDRRRALDAGFDEHMVKPVNIEVLLAHLKALLLEQALS
ncbi:MAG: ATP-binding protein [Rhizobacter sp.]